LISANCPQVISALPLLTRDNIHPGKLEDVLKTSTLHDDVGDCLRYDYKSMLDPKSQTPRAVRAQEIFERYQDPNARAMAFRIFEEKEKNCALCDGARDGDENFIRKWRRLVRAFLDHRITEQLIELDRVEARQTQLEIERLQLFEFDRQQILIPTGIQREVVIGEHQRFALRRRRVPKHNHRHFRHSELLRSEQPRISGDDHIVAAD
jgi:hypothetical protein